MAVKTSWAAGDVLTAADLTDTFAAKFTTPGAWTAYSPAFGFNGGSGWTVGTSAVGGAYTTIGKTVIFYAWLTISSWTVGSTGNLTITLPVNLKNNAIESVGGIHCRMRDVSASYDFGGVVTGTSTSAGTVLPGFRIKTENHAGYSIYNGSPFLGQVTPANGDTFFLNGTYEGA